MAPEQTMKKTFQEDGSFYYTLPSGSVISDTTFSGLEGTSRTEAIRYLSMQGFSETDREDILEEYERQHSFRAEDANTEDK